MVDVNTAAGRLLLPSEDQVITPILRRYGVWEPAETRFLLSTLRPGDTFVEVGAHVGYFSVLAAKRVGANGAVIAIEPETRNLALLRSNLARNGCTNAHVVPFAAYSTSGWMSLALDEENRGGHRLVPLGQTPTRIRCAPLDDLVPARVDVVKIDTQGYDHEVVEGMEHTLTTNPRVIVLAELSLSELGRRGIEPDVAVDRYRELGFTISTFDEYGRLRRTSAEQVLADCRAGRFPADFSLVLERPPAPPAGVTDLSVCPRASAGLAATEASDGLIVFERSRDRIHELNDTAAVVFTLCNGEHTVARLIELVQEAYELPDPPTDEVRQCLAHLYSEGLLM